jgi:cysteine desulfurase
MSPVSAVSVYLDHAATTPVRPEAVAAMMPFLTGAYGNPASLHLAGQTARRALEDARETVAAALDATPEEIIFTSGGTESDNLALRGVLSASGKRHLVTASVEHKAVLSTCSALEEEGFQVSYLPVNRDGVVDMDALRKALRPETACVSVMLGNNETGVMQPIQEIAAIAGKSNVLLHTDAVQAVGKMPVNVQTLGVDLLTVSAHKLGGPKGAGALYVRRGTRLRPILHGGHQERDLRPGTENVAGIVGFAKAMELARREMPDHPARLAALRDRLEQGILRRVPGARLNGHRAQRLPHILNMGFEGIEADSLLLMLDLRGVAVSTGSACASGAAEGSHVLKAMGLEPCIARGSLRFSVGHGNTDAEMDTVTDLLSEIVPQVRQTTK